MLSEKYAIPCYAKSKLLEYAREKELYDKYPYLLGEIPTDFLMSSLDENVMERVRNTPKEALSKLMGGQDCIIIGRTAIISNILNYISSLTQDELITVRGDALSEKVVAECNKNMQSEKCRKVKKNSAYLSNLFQNDCNL